MLPALACLIAAYTIARLIQVPIEHSTLRLKWVWLLVISLPAIGVIAFLAAGILYESFTLPSPQMPRGY